MHKKPTPPNPAKRDFMSKIGVAGLLTFLGGVIGLSSKNVTSDDTVWQLDPEKCVQCGRCATHCVLSESAVKCVHAYEVCGYCELCGGYHQPNIKKVDFAAENQLCPTSAIKRTYLEDPYFEYSIEESLCIGCAKCVAGCSAFGNGSLYLQVRHDRCTNCNTCTIAQVCPADAFARVPASEPYLLKTDKDTTS